MSKIEVPHSREGGTYDEYQKSLTDRYLKCISSLEQSTQSLANECKSQISKSIQEYQAYKAGEESKLKDILDSMKTTSVSFEDLKEQVIQIGENVLNHANELKSSSMIAYQKSFDQLQPMIDKIYADLKDQLPILDPQYSDRLPTAIKSLNEMFYKNKTQMEKMFDSFIESAKKSSQDNVDEFLKRSDDWRTNRFETVFNDAKNKLDPLKQLEYGTIFEDFYREQAKFTLCFQKIIQNYTIIMPPDKFTSKDVEQWWDKAEEMLQFHNNFINMFTTKITDHLNANILTNSNLLQDVEQELQQLKGDAEAANAIAELTPLHKHSQKLNSIFIEKLTKFWDGKRTVLRKVFETLHSFILPIVQRYEKYINETKNCFDEVSKNVTTVTNKSNDEITKYETQFSEKEAEISLLANEKDINNTVTVCKGILDQIEKEYRSSYDQIVEIYDQQPEKVKKLFEEGETELLTILKLRKTVNAPEFDSFVKATNSHSRINSARKSSAILRRPKLKDLKLNIFIFGANNGAKFEEIEPITVIPEFDENSDEQNNQGNQKGKGKGKPPIPKPKKPLPKTPNSKNKGKKGAQDNEDYDMPEFNLVTSIPKIDDHLAIEIYTPQNNEISSWVNEFRKSVICSINDQFSDVVYKVQFKLERNKWANQLNERMRTHAPRLSQLELNTAKTRVLQIESRKMLLEKHFHHSAASFNKTLQVIEPSIEQYKQSMFSKIEELRPLINKISEIHSVQHFVELEQEFKIMENHFLSEYEEEKNKEKELVRSLESSFKQLNDRFIETVLAQDSYSNDERTNAMAYFDKMNNQVSNIYNALNEKINNASTEIEHKYQQLTEEFQQLVPKHTVDVTFIESLNAQQHVAKSKYDTLCFRNRQQEQEIDSLISQLSEALQSEENPQQKILSEFESIERLRIALVKRGKHLMIMKSDISHDPIGYNIDLETQVVSSDHDKEQNDKDKKNKRNQKKPSTSKPKISSKKAPEQDSLGTMQGQIDQITSSLTQTSTKTITDYFSQLKTTKSNICRVNEIKPNQNECIDNVKQVWNKQIENKEQIFSSSGLKYRTQVSQSLPLLREATVLIYDCVVKYYADKIELLTVDNKDEFNNKMKELRTQRDQNVKALSPKLSDSNNISELKKLYNSEEERRKNELTVIQNYENSIIETEKNVMNMFTSHLPLITSSLMSLFDKFPLLEDLIPGPVANEERRTLKSLIKDKERKSMQLPDDQDRPFHVRQWPTLPLTMEPLSSMTSQTESQDQQTKEKNSGRKTVKKPKKSDAIKSVESAMMPIITSIDTSMHRGVIVERNRSFEEYQREMKSRVTSFETYINFMKEETQKFSEFWLKSINNLCPRFVIPKESK